MASILQPYNRDECFLCGMRATDTHHVFYGAGLREVSELYGLTVRLCRQCHTEGRRRCTGTATSTSSSRSGHRKRRWSTTAGLLQSGAAFSARVTSRNPKKNTQ